ncbi:MAG TPA: DNA recombination protein RmuC [Ruminococcaceae bacterium]|nr:DNA recombination protein RmuC [Oscillospiraceae bacterium]
MTKEMIILFAVILLLFVVIVVLLLALLFGRKSERNDRERTERRLADEFERNRRESALSQGDLHTQIAQNMKDMNARIEEMSASNFEAQTRMSEALNKSLNAIRENNSEQNEKMTRVFSDSMSRMQESNEKKLEQMRETVDEKLNKTLATRLDSSFKTVSDQLESVNKSLGEMKELSNGVTTNVTSLNRILTNVKVRGTWAEIQLENLLDQTIPGMYVKNYAPIENSTARVEFAVKIPSAENGSVVYLPIDSKFPMEDYAKLCQASEQADYEAVAAAKKALMNRIKDEAKQINKYIVVPQTTPYAIMYLATEGLYAEVAAAPDGLPEQLRSDYNIMIAGPSTITALLSSLSMGFKAIAINEKANEVRKTLAVAKAQYDKFGDLLEKARKRVDDAGRALGEAQDRNRIIQKKLKGIEALDSNEQKSLEEQFFEGE